MEPRLKVYLQNGWSDHSEENPDGPPTFERDLSACPGALQFSYALYVSGEEPNPSTRDLIEMSIKLGAKHDAGKLVEAYSGPCAFGQFGTAVFHPAGGGRMQIWHLSNGRDFILATHVNVDEPDPVEVQEAQEIVRDVGLTAG